MPEKKKKHNAKQTKHKETDVKNDGSFEGTTLSYQLFVIIVSCKQL